MTAGGRAASFVRDGEGGGSWGNRGSPTFADVVSSAVIRRAAMVKMVVIAALAALVATLVAVLIRWLPESASEEMDRITFVYWFATIICIGIFALVAAVIIEAVWAFRVQPDDDTDGPPIHGNTRLEIAWTIVPAILVIAIGVVSAVVLSKNADAGSNPLHVKVFAQQFAWRFEYPGKVMSDELVMPLHRNVKFEMQSADVIHSLWIPQMGQKQDVVPGITTEIVITPTRTGTFTLICTELCGLGHAVMRAQAFVLSAADYEKWIAAEKAKAAATGSAAGKTLFTQQCGSCHRLADAGTQGEVGPDLDKVLAGKDADFIHESIVNPNAEIAPGFQPNVMPSTFGESLTDAQLQSLVDYLVKTAGKS